MSTMSGSVTCTRTPRPRERPRPRRKAAPGISFLKEQQWALDFGTAVVREQAVRESIRVPARLEPRPGGAADVARADRRPADRVAEPHWARRDAGRNSRGCCRRRSRPATCRSCSGRARTRKPALTLATRDRERAERLTTAGAAPAEAARRSARRRRAGESAAHRRGGQPRATQRGPDRRGGRRRGVVHGPRAARPGSIAAARRDHRRQRHRRHLLFRDRRCHRRYTSSARSRRPRWRGRGRLTPPKSKCRASPPVPGRPAGRARAGARSAVAHAADHLRVRQPHRRLAVGQAGSFIC